MAGIAIATSTRADWGLLSPLASELRRRGHEPSVLATGMHLQPEYGMTVREIEADGFNPAATIEATGAPGEVISKVVAGFSEILTRLRPEALIILGDRSEMLGVAMAATVCGVPIVHIAGGTVSEGAIDDNIRHALTKLSSLHLVETERCARRVLQMGEDPKTVIVTGAIGVCNILSTPRMSRAELEANIGWKFGERNILATLHPETRGTLSPTAAMHNFLEALRVVMTSDPGLNLLLTYPNSDVDPTPQVALMKALEAEMPLRVKTVKSLGRVRYMSTLDVVDAVAGNSSGGIVEVVSAGVPVLDVGDRQKGREHGAAVTHCGVTVQDITEGLRKVLSPGMRRLAARRENPYYRPDTPSVMADAILSHDFHPYPSKKFHEFSLTGKTTTHK